NAVVDRVLFKEFSRKRKCGIRCIPCRGHHIALSLHKSARAVVYCGITPASSVTFVHTVLMTCSEDLVNISLHAVGHLKPPYRCVVDNDIRPCEVFYLSPRVKPIVYSGNTI